MLGCISLGYFLLRQVSIGYGSLDEAQRGILRRTQSTCQLIPCFFTLTCHHLTSSFSQSVPFFSPKEDHIIIIPPRRQRKLHEVTTAPEQLLIMIPSLSLFASRVQATVLSLCVRDVLLPLLSSSRFKFNLHHPRQRQ